MYVVTASRSPWVRFPSRIGTLAFGLLVCVAASLAWSQPVVIPFDFESQFDNGRYGRMVGESVWKKLERMGTVVIPESMLDVRSTCERLHFRPVPTTPLEEMAKVIREEFGADLAIWGKVERPQGVQYDTYDLWVIVADFRTSPPKKLYEKKVRTKTVSEIPHVYLKEALAALQPTAPKTARTDEAMYLAEERWRSGPNLVKGDFEKGASHPDGWDPLPKHVTWVTASSASERANNRLIRFVVPPNVAATTGVLYYSEYFPIEEGATYRFQCRWRSTGTAAKVFIKCYDELPTRFRSGSGASHERREVYRSQQNLKGAAGEWHTHTEEFTPRHTQYTPRYGRVMLYAYYPAGTVEWDDVVVKQIQPAPESSPKERRPSLETKVRSEVLEQGKE